MIPDFTKTDYLREGNDSQRNCFRLLEKSRIMEILSEYSPVVAGTIPIGIDIPGSDVDILCCATDFNELESLLRADFGGTEGFRCEVTEGRESPSFVCSFMFDGTEIEIFAQDNPVTEQNGYCHMITEHALLEMHGEEFRTGIIELKKSGMKTEPAFARLLGLEGDPYNAVLKKGEELGLYSLA